MHITHHVQLHLISIPRSYKHIYLMTSIYLVNLEKPKCFMPCPKAKVFDTYKIQQILFHIFDTYFLLLFFDQVIFYFFDSAFDCFFLFFFI